MYDYSNQTDSTDFVGQTDLIGTTSDNFFFHRFPSVQSQIRGVGSVYRPMPPLVACVATGPNMKVK